MLERLKQCLVDLKELGLNNDIPEIMRKTELIDISRVNTGIKNIKDINTRDTLYEMQFTKVCSADNGTIYIFSRDLPEEIEFCTYIETKKYAGVNARGIFTKKTGHFDILPAHKESLEKKGDLDNFLKGCVSCLFDIFYFSERINCLEKYYTEPKKTVLRDRRQKTKEKVSKVTYIYLDKKEAVKEVSREYGKITRDFSWHVRGHWRKHDGSLGKDRDGNYTVKGYTWVIPYIKGEGKLQKKIKIVK